MDIKTLLKNRNFVNLWLSQICSQLSYNLLNFSLLFIVFKLTKSSFSESLLVLTFILPTAIFGTFTGVLADDFDKRKIMMVAHVIWPVVALLFIPTFHISVFLILFLSFLINSIDRFFTPAEQSSLPQLVSKEELLIANSLFSFSINAAFLIGFSLAGPLMLLTGNDFTPIYLASALMLISTFFVFKLPHLSPLYKEKKEKFIKQTLLEIKSGFAFVKNKKVVFYGIAIFSLLQIFMNVALSLSPAFVSKSLGFEDASHASWVVMLPVGLGSIISLYVIQKWQAVLKRHLISRGILFSSISLFTLGFVPIIYKLLENEHIVGKITRSIIHFTGVSSIIFVSCFFLGLSVTLIIVPALTAISENTPADMLGKVWGIASLSQNLLASIPLLLIGFLADRISVVPLILIVSTAGIILYFWGRRGILDKLLG